MGVCVCVCVCVCVYACKVCIGSILEKPPVSACKVFHYYILLHIIPAGGLASSIQVYLVVLRLASGTAFS